MQLFKKIEKSSLLFNLTVLLWVSRMAVPEFIYIFIPVYLFLIIILLIKIVHVKSIVILEFFQVSAPLIILLIFYLSGIFISTKLYKKEFIDLAEFTVNITLILYMFIYIYQNQNKESFHLLFDRFIRLIQIAALIIAILGLIKFIIQLSGYNFNNYYPFGTALNSDSNVFGLFLFMGIAAFIKALLVSLTKQEQIKYQVYIFLIASDILFSFSQRSVILLVSLTTIFLVLHLFPRKKTEKKQLLNFKKNTRLLFYTIIFTIIFIGATKENLNKQIAQHTEYQLLNQGSSFTDNLIETFHIDKWQFAVEIYSNYSFTEKAFGSGFDYLKLYGDKFNTSELYYYSYPHNPILSALLYSGLLGALFVFIFLLLSFYYTFANFRAYPAFSIMSFISLFFVFFSGNSIFSIPIFLYLFSLSFIIHQIEITEFITDININKPGSRVMKEFFDFVLSSITFIIFIPLLLLVSIFILVQMGRPVLFAQQRIGRNAKLFTLYKFRTMSTSISNTSIAANEGNRITRFGAFLRKTKLDELPELWNIMRGDMSFVGPRPDETV